MMKKSSAAFFVIFFIIVTITVPMMTLNDDGSVDIYFGKTAQKGLESNWTPTAGEDFFLLFRFYGPEQPYFDKTFKLPNIELMK